MSDTPNAAPAEGVAPIVVDKSAKSAQLQNTFHMIALVVSGVLLGKVLPDALVGSIGGPAADVLAGIIVAAPAVVWRYLKTWRTHFKLTFMANRLPDRVAQVKP